MDIGTIIGNAIGLVGIVLSIAFYFRSKRGRELTWSVEHHRLIRSSKADIPGLKIIFNDEEIPSLNSTLLTIENTGNSDIAHSDVFQAIQFLTGLEKEQFLNARLLDEHAQKPNKFKITASEDFVEFDFKYMGKQDYAQIQILHIAENVPKTKLTGKINGGELTQRKRKIVGMAIGGLLVAAGMAPRVFSFTWNSFLQTWDFWGGIINSWRELALYGITSENLISTAFDGVVIVGLIILAIVAIRDYTKGTLTP